jgi:MFS family permease
VTRAWSNDTPSLTRATDLGASRATRASRRSATSVAVVVMGFTAMLASSPGQSYWLSLFVDPMISDTGLSRTAFTAIYGAATLSSAALVLWIGRTVDRRGLGFGWLIVAAGLALGCVVASFAAGALVTLIALAMLRAFGQGSFPLLGTLLIAGRLRRWRARGLAVSHLGSTLAAAALPALALVLIETFGWRDTYRLVAVTVAVLIAPLALVVAHLAPRSSTSSATSPRNGSTAFKAFPWRDGGGALLVILAAPPLVSTAIVFHATSLFAQRGLPLHAAAAGLAVLALAGAAGALIAGILVDRFGPRLTLAGKSLLLLAAASVMLAPSDLAAYAPSALSALGPA